MRNPSTRGKSDDLSCLTSSSTSSRDQSNAKYPILVDSDNNSAQFTSTYLPQVIDPQEWNQQNVSRKRKERQDSTSSITQDRKLVRSNSEEYLPNIDYEVIRRVSSHEEIKQPANEIDGVTTPLLQTKQAPDEDDDDDDDDDNDDDECIINRRSYQFNDDVASIKSANNEVQEILRDAYRRSETSPARSRTFDFSHKLRVSPNRDTNNHNNDALSDMQTMSDRRSSERFCKARAAQGFRKSSSSKKSSAPSLIRQSSSTDSEHNESTYKYDITTMKSERRGFTSTKTVVPTPATSAIDFKRQFELQSSISSEYGDDYNDLSSSFSDHNDNNDYTDFMPISPSGLRSPITTSRHESLPWDCTHEPVKSQRFADDKFDHVNNTRDTDMKLRNESFVAVSIPHFAKGENLKTRDLMKSNQLPNVFTTPDEKLKQINKRLIALKKRVATFEENFEMENGYRPSLSIKLNERYVKNALADIHKLRKEKQALKADPMNAMGYKSTHTTANDSKVQNMIDTIAEIEKRLQIKRGEEHRPEVLEEMTADQLVQEKTAVQRALLYLESLYGRPTTRDERDAARLLYNRYRVIKRLVNRTVSIAGSGISNPSELPTILEHEAMAFTVAAISLTPPPSDTEVMGSNVASGIDSSTDSTDTSSSINENVHEMSLDGLTRSLEIVRDEKKKLRRTIKEFEEVFEEQNGRKMLKSDRIAIEETYALYKQKKAKLRLLDALVRKQLTH
ncbi:protein FAM13A isoform X2 [Contarinia nasturtii]|nr:protein FAM13A isoform X2 [Contarinia nasturtii]XP_031624225.1 protein FAM13A isoform X2 [Contarinia nasturtii]XP_031624233.1 protein FAM13A isoform X2 [Contarinia nasturtii]